MSRYALALDGYDSASIWGYDELSATYFAQMWRNTSDPWDDPDIWLAGLEPISSAARLATMIAARTSASLAAVLRAMASARTAPEAAELARLADVATASRP